MGERSVSEFPMWEGNNSRGHVLAVPYPSQGHINPMLQFCKRLSTTRPITATLAATAFISTTFAAHLGPPVRLATISDGFDDGGFSAADSVPSYLASLEAAGSRSLSDLIRRHAAAGHPITCVVYDSFMPWVLTVAKDHGIFAAAFFTQPCTVNFIYHQVQRGAWRLDDLKPPVRVPGMEVALEMEDMPSFIGVRGSYPAYFEMALNQSSNVHLADCVLVNAFYELEPKIVDSMSKLVRPLLPIGPTIPSFYLTGENKDDKDYGLNLFRSSSSTNPDAINWLSAKPPGSVIYVSFGSMTCMSKEQVEEVASALKHSNYDFFWAMKASEKPKLPNGIEEEMSSLGKGFFAEWCSQLQVLSSDAVGCFLTHCGWNSTQEALSLGVPMVGMPQWTDQMTNAKLVQDVWRTGMRAKANENGIVTREVIGECIGQVMRGDKALEVRANARGWRSMATQAVSHGGSSDKNIDVFLSMFAN